MAQKRTGLGRGIGALIPTADQNAARPSDVFFDGNDAADLVQVPGAVLAQLNPDDIVPNPRQPRTDFDQEELDELVHSVREFGVMQPIVVRPIERDDPRIAQGVHYELVMGERRLRASRLAGLPTIPAVVKQTGDDAMLRDALLENLHRSNLNPLDEASAYQQLLEDFGITQDELATRIGRSRPQITNTLRLMRLPDPVKRQVAAGVLSAGHARALLGVSDADALQKLADRVIREELTVRQVEALAGREKPAASRKPKPRGGSRQAQLDEIAGRLGDHLDTRARITLGAAKGQVVIDFASVSDLNRILNVIGLKGYNS